MQRKLDQDGSQLDARSRTDEISSPFFGTSPQGAGSWLGKADATDGGKHALFVTSGFRVLREPHRPIKPRGENDPK